MWRSVKLYLQVTDDAVMLWSGQAAGGGRREVGGPTNHQVSSRWVATSLCATVGGRRELLACHSNDWGNTEGEGKLYENCSDRLGRVERNNLIFHKSVVLYIKKLHLLYMNMSDRWKSGLWMDQSRCWRLTPIQVLKC